MQFKLKIHVKLAAYEKIDQVIPRDRIQKMQLNKIVAFHKKFPNQLQCSDIVTVWQSKSRMEFWNDRL